MLDSFMFIPVIVLLTAMLLMGIGITLKRHGASREKKRFKSKDAAAALKDANRRLAQNPKDASALTVVAEAYFNEQNWEKAFKTYNLLQELCATEQDLDEFTITLRLALSAIKLKNYNVAYKNFLIARSMRDDVFEVNFNLGYLEYMKKNFEKSAGYLSQARTLKTDHPMMLKYLGLSLFKLMRFNDAAQFLKQAMDLDPSDKETLFALGQTYQNLNRGDMALKIFTHLRGDPVLGPKAALSAGTQNFTSRQFEKAIMDFEIGLRHENIEPKVKEELIYRLGVSYIKNQAIPQGLKHLKDLQDMNPGYKDVAALIQQYSELNSNKNLQVYLISETSSFVALCRRLSVSMFPSAKVKVVNISVNKNEYADILAEVYTAKWEDVVLFRYMRTTGSVGELILRDLNSKIKDLKAGRGFCFTAGEFTDGARQFVEARLIDLVEKESLRQKLEMLDRG